MDTVANFLLVLFGSGAGVTLASLALEHRRHDRTREESARHLLLRVAFALEGYAIDCADKLSDHKLANSSDGSAGRYLAAVPQVPALPEGPAYAHIKPDILETILDFPQRCKMADRETAHWWDVLADIDCVRTAATANTTKMGERAVRLAQRIRREYGLPKRNLTFGEWDISAFFERELRRVSELEAKRSDAEKTTNDEIV